MHIMKNKTQIQIAAEAGITQGHLSKIMSGKANPTMRVLKKIAKSNRISIASLIKKIEKSCITPTSQIAKGNVAKGKTELDRG